MKTAERLDSRGFTRLEVLACVLGCGLVMAVILPGLANSTARSDRVVCFNNLRQIGVGYSNLGLEHDGLPPWMLTINSGGNTNHPLKQNLYLQFSAISNFVGTPKVLADPGDRRRNLKPAWHWGPTEGGIWNPGYQNNSVSYFLGISGTFRTPRAVLSGDLNLSIDRYDSGGSIVPSVLISSSTAEWTNAVHGSSGNLLFFDGSVEQVDTRQMREAFQNGAGSRDTNGIVYQTRLMMTFN